MDNKEVSIYIRKGKAYIPVLAKTDDGFYLNVSPVYTVDLDIENLANIIGEVLKAGNPRIPTPSTDEMRRLPQPVLQAAKVTSWKKLAQGGTAYDISERPEGYTLEFSKKDEKGRFVTDSYKTREFPLSTDLKEIVQAMFEDIHSHPELLK